MSLRTLLVTLLALATALSGCTEPKRDLESDAADREAWAKEHNAYDPVARLAGPQVIAPGAVVWYTAQGSHDPDFIGAKSERAEARSEGGVQYRDHYADVTVSWSDSDSATRGLGVGIRELIWQVDDGPRLVAPELTYRYGTEDGPVRFPVGFVAPGNHTIQLTVIDWSGAADRVRMAIEVAAGGVESKGELESWSTTETGWSRTFTQTIDTWEVGRCPGGYDSYDASRDHITMPWELLFFAEGVAVDVTWDRVEAPVVASPTSTGLLAVAQERTATAYGLNTNDVDLTLGHCANGGEWARFAGESTLTDETPRESGSVDGVTFAENIVRGGHKGGYVAEWDHNAYLSGEGQWRGGTGTPVAIAYTFLPASSTSGGAL